MPETPMHPLPNIAGLTLSPIVPDHPLKRVLAAALPAPMARGNSGETLFWSAAYFGLDQVRIFQEAGETRQQTITQLACQALLEEAYLIEKTGMGYMAKMGLLAESLEERMLYSLFAADEATHLAQIRGFLAGEPEQTTAPFVQLLAQVVENDDRAVLVFVLQVVLEGWGLSHYRHLAKACCHGDLAQVLRGFLQAESRHHATGQILFEQTSRSSAAEASMVEILAAFLQMVQVGPQQLLGAIAQVQGDLSRQQQIAILEQLDTLHHSGSRLELLRSLMERAGAGSIVQALQARGLFEPLPADRCVR